MNRGAIRLASSFRNKMILIFLAITVVPFVLFSYYAYDKSIEGIENANSTFSLGYLQQTKTNFETYLRNLNDQVNQWIGNRKLQQLLEEPPRSKEAEEAFTVDMLSVEQNKPRIDAQQMRVFPMNPSLYPTYMNTIGESAEVVNEEWFIRSSASKVPTWNLVMPKQGRYPRPMLMYVKRFTGLNDPVARGMVVTEVSEDYLMRYFSPSDDNEGQKFLIVDETGLVLYDSENAEWTGRAIPSEEFLKQRERQAEGTDTLTIEGEKQLLTFVRLDSEPWTVVSLTPLSTLSRLGSDMNRLMVAFLIIYSACAVGVVIFLTLHFTQPIARLVRLMRKMEQGDFESEVPVTERKDEIGWLYRGFRGMVRKIEGLIEQASFSERKKRELEFQVLSHQINPHFLYNTLESIRWKAENHGRSDIGEMVSSLGNLLRLSLNQGKEVTTVGREIEQVKAYVRIEQARMGMPLRVLYSFDDRMLAMPFLRLLLQPIVENAIQHSIRDNFDKGKVVLVGYLDDRDLVIEITDNGRGIPEHVLQQLNEEEPAPWTKRQGVGLRNVNDRLKLYFGTGYALRIETGEGQGTKITIRHPIMEAEEGVPDSPNTRRE